MKKLFVLFLLLLILSPNSFAANEGKTIVVSGNGVILVDPDTATVRMGVDVMKKTAAEAQAENAGIMEDVINAIQEKGISKANIQTIGFNIWPEMKYEQNQPAKIVGYRCSNQVIVTVEDMNIISKILDGGISAGANNVQGIEFSKKNDLEAKKEALTEAVKEAQAKAEAIAKASGLTIKGIDNIVEGGVEVYPKVNALESRGGALSTTPISSGMIEVRGSVTTTYKVE